MKNFMIDIETTGIGSAENDVLQIGVLEMIWNGDIWTPGKTFEHVCHTDKKPESAFAKEHMAPLYERCNAMNRSFSDPVTIRECLLKYFSECGETPPNVFVCGWNASNFDMPFLFDKKMLVPSYYETIDGQDVMRGDVHYRVYEIGGSLQLARDVLGMPAGEVAKKARELCPEVELPAGEEHDAIYDCYSQLKLLNGLIRLLRGSK